MVVLVEGNNELNVKLKWMPPPPGLYGSATTDSAALDGVKVTLDSFVAYTALPFGEYAFVGVAPGSYVITFEKENYETIVREIIVVEGYNELNVSLVLVAAPMTIRLYGRATDSRTGTGIVGVKLNIYEWYGTPVPAAYTDSLGDYSVDLVPSRYLIQAYKLGYKPKWITSGLEYSYQELASDTRLDFTLEVS